MSERFPIKPLDPDHPIFKRGWSVYTPWRRPTLPAPEEKPESAGPVEPPESDEHE